MKRIYLLYTFLFFTLSCVYQCSIHNENFSKHGSTGLSDVDAILKVIKQNPTTSTNFESRRAALFRWWRLLWRQGINLDSFDKTADVLVNGVRENKQDYVVIDSGYLTLEKIQANPVKISEFRAEKLKKSLSDSKTDWLFYYGTKDARRGYSPDPGPQLGEIAWKYPKGYYWNAAPVIENGRIYTSSPGIDIIGFCLDEKTGEVIWRGSQNGIHFYGEPTPRWPPLLSEENVFIRTADDPESIKAFDRRSGKRIQTPDVNSSRKTIAYYKQGISLVLADPLSKEELWTYSDKKFFAGQPLIAESFIYASQQDGTVLKFPTSRGESLWKTDLKEKIGGRLTITPSGLFAGTNARKLYKLDPADGSIQWVFQSDIPENKSYQFFSAATIKEDRVYVGASDKMLYCLNIDNGSLIWEIELSDWIRAKPFVIENTVYVATLDGTLYALVDGGDNCHIKFKVQLGRHGITADLNGSKNGIVAIGRDLMMYSVDPLTGKIQWKRGIVDGAWKDGHYYFADWNGGLLGSPTAVDDIIYIGGPDGFVNAVDANTGEELWRFETNSTTSLAPTIVGDKVFFGYLGSTHEHYGFEMPGEYFAVNKNSGEPIWSSTDYGNVWVSAAYSSGVLFFGNTDGYVFGVDPDTGKKYWSFFTGKNTAKENLPKDTPFTHGYPMGVYCVPTFDENNFYTGSWSGYYFAFDQKTGKLKWRCETKATDWGGLPDSAAPTLW